MESLVFRVWAAQSRGSDLTARSEHNTLEAAVASARRLAVREIAAVELPGRRWHRFEGGLEAIGPEQTVTGQHAPVEVAKSRPMQTVTGQHAAVEVSKPRPGQRVTGQYVSIGPPTAQAKPRQSQRVTAQHEAQRAASEAEAGDGSERRRKKRMSVVGVRGETVSHLADGTPVRLLDVSESGMQLQLPARYRLNAGGPIGLKVRSRRGAVEVTGTVAWVRRHRCGVQFDWETTPSFAKTFIRGLIDDASRQQAWKQKQK